MEYFLVAQRAKAVIVSSSWDIRSDLIEYLEEFGVFSMIVDNFVDIPYSYLIDYEPKYIFIGVDEFGGPALLYDQLCTVRDSLPNTAIVLVSAEFSTDEYGTHRRQIADVSLRFPFSRSALFYALKQGPINHGAWKRRKLELVAR